ncbi:LysM peptidoglycan-binding domain-containing protein [Phytohabitans kaempferiae]|uniref:LysM peptidoglycan-binding domain-containing protein n=1 Tax=Phytohabitans kaempferiae TaxID=1620943 RepID=A0ABV6M2U0_9ACTN
MAAAVLGATAATTASGVAAAAPPAAAGAEPATGQPAADRLSAASFVAPEVVDHPEEQSADGTAGTGARAHGFYTVAESDWLWAIAGRFLGDPQRYDEIAKLNAQLERADPRFPDHIEPGQQLRLPAEARDRGTRPHAKGTTTAAADAASRPPTPKTETTSPPTRPPHPVQPEGPPATESVPRPPERGGSIGADELLAVTAVLVNATVLAALIRYRLHQRRRPRPNRARPQPPPTSAAIQSAGTLDVERIDRALRALPPTLRHREDTAMPDIVAVWVTHGDINLVLAQPTPAAPAPFIADSTGTTWSLPRQASLGPSDGPAPLPALATVAANNDGHLLIDLERTGVLAINGDRERGTDLLRYLAAELVTNQWSDDMEIVLAGFDAADAEHIAALGGSRITTAGSVAAAIAQAHDDAGKNAVATQDSDEGTTCARRVRGGDTGKPHVLLIADPAGNEDALRVLSQYLASADGRAVTVVASAAIPTTWQVTVASDGTLTIDWLDADDLTASRLPATQLAGMAALFNRVRTDTRPNTTDPEDQTTTGSQRPASGHDSDSPLLAIEAPPPAPVDTGPSRPVPDQTVVPPRALLPPDAFAGENRTTVTRSGQSEPDLEADLNDWYSPEPHRPRIAILGPVHVQAPGEPPDERRRFYSEIIVYVAQRGERGATGEQIDDNLWPQQQVNP